MQPSTTPIPSHISHSAHAGARDCVRIEPLERRTLMSGWGTEETIDNNGQVYGMAADQAGNVYAVGYDYYTDRSLVRQKPSGSTTWSTIFQTSADLYTCAVDRAGNLFVGGRTYNQTYQWTVLERPAPTADYPQPTFKTIDSFSAYDSRCFGLASDAAGNVFAVGQSVTSKGGNWTYYWSARKGTYDSSTGNWSFVTVDQQVGSGASTGATAVASAVTVVDSGPSAGIYAAGRIGSNWVVRKAGASGTSWAAVDSFRYDTVGSATSVAKAIASDLDGNIYVVGSGAQSTITGYNKNKTPIYARSPAHWLVRSSRTGGSGSWTIADDFFADGSAGSYAFAAGTDSAGNVYVAGGSTSSTYGGSHAIVRTNAGGTWSSSDDLHGDSNDPSRFADYTYRAFTADPVTGMLYAGGSFHYADDYSVADGWLIRSAPAATSSLAGATFASTTFDLDDADELDALFDRAADEILV
jgi:hypothetical protein